MIPAPFVLVLLALASFRTYRLFAWDSFPPIARSRDRIVGAQYGPGQDVEFRRPLLAEWLLCAWCSGLLWSTGWYVAWLEQPRWTLYAAVPLAVSAVVGVAQSFMPD